MKRPFQIGGRRQAHLEAVAVRVSVNTYALVNDALHLAMTGKSHAIRRGAAARVEFGERDLGRRQWEVGESCERRTRPRSIHWALGEGRLRAKSCHGNGGHGRTEQQVQE
jgi:hypothetical protein